MDPSEANAAPAGPASDTAYGLVPPDTAGAGSVTASPATARTSAGRDCSDNGSETSTENSPE